jgi:hypothetical protein
MLPLPTTMIAAGTLREAIASLPDDYDVAPCVLFRYLESLGADPLHFAFEMVQTGMGDMKAAEPR